MSSIVNTTIKISLIAIIATWIGYAAGIQNYLTVGVIGILSVQVTKYDSLKSGLIRFLNAFYALGLSFILFLIFGIEIWVFGVFTVIFIFTSFLMKLELGMVPSIVLISHVFNSTTLSWALFLEELNIVLIAIGVALIINLIYPQFWLKSVVKELNHADQLTRDHLFMVSVYLKKVDEPVDFIKHQKLINESFNEVIKKVEKLDKDKPFANDHRYLGYLLMRKNQMEAINLMYERLSKIKEYHLNNDVISNYIEQLVSDIGYEDKAVKQLGMLGELIKQFETQELPKTRKEFETRAMLLQMLYDIETLLKSKIQFHELYKDFKM